VLDADAPVAPYWTKGTQWRLPAEVREAGKVTTRFAWQVQVLAGEPGQGDAKPASPASEERVFSWMR
jgi:hypothetical protein